MDDKLYRQLLSQVADWQIPKLTNTEVKVARQRSRGRGRPSLEEQYQEEHEEIFLDLFEGINPTHPPELTNVKVAGSDCEDCGADLPQGRQMQIKFYPATPGHIAHRRDRCMNCNYYRNPYTNVYDLPQGPAAQQYLNWAKHEFSVRNKLAKNNPDK